MKSNKSKEKTPIVDVRCMDSSNQQFIVEIQFSPQKEFKKRALYYLSKVFSRQLLQGEGYDLLEPVYILSLLNFKLFGELEEGYHSYAMKHEQQADE